VPTDGNQTADGSSASVIVVGGGFAGVGCAKELGKHHIDVTLLDRHNYHQFQPLLYQVATGELAIADVARPLRGIFTRDETVDVRMAEVVGIDPDTASVTLAGGETMSADYLVVASGSIPNYFGTPGAERHAFPLYSATDAEQLRSRLFQVFEDADADPTRIDEGALNIVVIGGGPTGVETAGAVADLVNEVMPRRYHDLDVRRARIYLVDHGQVVLAAFSDKAHDYAAERLKKLGVKLLLGTGVTEVAADHVVLTDGSEIKSRTVVWGGGIKADDLTGFDQLDRGRAGRLTALADLTVEGHPNVYAIGDVANIPDHDGEDLPQLGSVALQAGRWAAQNIVADIAGKPRTPFRYHDKGIMAMIGRGSAVAEMGAHHHELHGRVAFAAWLGVHAWLMSGVRNKVDAFIAWAWDFLGSSRGTSIIDPQGARIDWGDDDAHDDTGE
jgi:NADH dehydrogenase